MDTQLAASLPQPLPIVVLILSLFALCFLALVGLIMVDHLVERRTERRLRGQSLQLNFDALISELTASA